MKLKLRKKDVLFSILFVLFLYIMTVFNLAKITKIIEWNIFKSEGIFELFIYFLIAAPLIYAFTGEKKENIEMYKEKGKEE